MQRLIDGVDLDPEIIQIVIIRAHRSLWQPTYHRRPDWAARL